MWFAFRGQDLTKLWSDLIHADYRWIALAVIVSMIAHVIRAMRWIMLIKPLGFQPAVSTTFHAVMIGYLANLAFPRMGEVSRCGVLAKTDKVPMNSLVGTVIIERIIDLISLLLIMLVAVIIEFETISTFLYENLLKGLIETITSNPVLLSILLLGFISAIFVAVRVFSKHKERILANTIARKIYNLWIGIRAGIMSVIHLQKTWLFVVYTVLIWLCYYLSSYFCFFALPATAHLSPMVALFVLVIGGLGMSAPVQGGIGAYHWIVSQGLILFAISQADGLAYATINHSTQTIMVLIFGAISLLFIVFKNRATEKNL